MSQFPGSAMPFDYYTRVRMANQQVWEGLNDLKALQREWNASDYGTTLPAGEGPHAGLVRADLGSVVFATADAISTLLDSGHATNMAKLL